MVTEITEMKRIDIARTERRSDATEIEFRLSLMTLSFLYKSEMTGFEKTDNPNAHGVAIIDAILKVDVIIDFDSNSFFETKADVRAGIMLIANG